MTKDQSGEEAGGGGGKKKQKSAQLWARWHVRRRQRDAAPLSGHRAPRDKPACGVPGQAEGAQLRLGGELVFSGVARGALVPSGLAWGWCGGSDGAFLAAALG